MNAKPSDHEFSPCPFKGGLGPTEEMMAAILESIDITFGKQIAEEDVGEPGSKKTKELSC